jgi:hypothetical protein
MNLKGEKEKNFTTSIKLMHLFGPKEQLQHTFRTQSYGSTTLNPVEEINKKCGTVHLHCVQTPSCNCE